MGHRLKQYPHPPKIPFNDLGRVLGAHLRCKLMDWMDQTPNFSLVGTYQSYHHLIYLCGGINLNL